MFTGIVTGTGEVLKRDTHQDRGVDRLTFSAPGHTEGLALGGSIAVNGVCVSAVEIDQDLVSVELINETLQRTTFGSIEPGDAINLERCLPAGARLDGHVVQGHVDGVGHLLSRDADTGTHRFAVPRELAEFLAEKGSIAIDGVSLTLTAVGEENGQHWCEVGLIPTTLAETTLGGLSLGGAVNLEVDVLAKYVKRMLHFQHDGAVGPSPESAALTGADTPHGAAPAVAIPAPSSPAPMLDSVEIALNQLAAGRPVVVVDDADRENEGDIIFPAAAATNELMAFTIRHTSGVLCTPMSAERAAHLQLPAMTATNEDPKGTAYTISCDAVAVTATGISAADRTVTAHVLGDTASDASALTRPGHMFPLVAHPQGVLGREGHTEAAVDLCRLAGFTEVGVIAELTHDDGTMMRLPALREFSDKHHLALISIADLIEYRGGTAKPEAVRESYLHSWDEPQRTSSHLVTGGPTVTLPTDYGEFQAQVWTERATGHEHILLSTAAPTSENPRVRMHSECLTGDVLHSHRCDCGSQLAAALTEVQEHGGHLLYLRGHEGRGIGLANKMRAYKLQEHGADTVEANEMLGLAAELRDYTGAAAILHQAGIQTLQLLTNNPAKVEALTAAGLTVTQVPSNGVVQEHNERYLLTKRDKMAHMLDHLRLTEQADVAPGSRGES